MSTEKRPLMAATHDGVFHADDVFAAAALRLAQPGVRIERTRDPVRLAAADITFDVGGGEFDHHQPGGNGARPNGLPYASFGLIWRRLGWDVVSAGMGWSSLSPDQIIEYATEVDRLLVQPIDAADNGVSLHTGEPAFEGVRGVSVSSLIAWLNPLGIETADTQFERAVALAEQILRRACEQAAEIAEGRFSLRAAVATCRRLGNRPYAVLARYVPDWQMELCQEPAILYVVYPSAGSWRVQGVPAVYGRPEVRKPLPEAWAGLDGPALQQVTGVADATFAHRGRFIAGAASQGGAIDLAVIAAVKE